MPHEHLTNRGFYDSMSGSQMDIAEVRKRKGLGRMALAQLSGVAYSTICAIEYGTMRCSERIGTALALALDVRPRDLSLPGGRIPSSSVEWNCECVCLENISVSYDHARDIQLAELRQEVRLLLLQLSRRERNIILMRFGIDGFSPHTLTQIGRAEGVSRERIRQIEARALRKLRKRKLRDYL